MSRQPTLLIDGKNTAYRAYFAGIADHQFLASGYHPFVIWLRFVQSWINKFEPEAIHVFWDCPKERVWRRQHLDTYKEQRNDDPREGVANGINAIVRAGANILPHMNCRQYYRDTQEADDLIYAACRVLSDRPLIVVSSDGDMVQMQYFMRHVQCYEPRKNQFVEMPDHNPVVRKCLMGDTSDNIGGYKGIGEVKSRRLAMSLPDLDRFLIERGSEIFDRNARIIDVSANPQSLANERYVMMAAAREISFDKSIISAKATENKVMGLTMEYARIVTPFKRLSVKNTNGDLDGNSCSNTDADPDQANRPSEVTV